MKVKHEKAFKEIEAMGFHPLHKEAAWSSGSTIEVSAEHGDDAADYYGEFRGGDPWINPKLEKWAEKKGLYWEWVNAGVIAAHEA